MEGGNGGGRMEIEWHNGGNISHRMKEDSGNRKVRNPGIEHRQW